jgi:hypothetical protein
MERLFAFLDLSNQERAMISQLADHGLVPSDLTKALIEESKIKEDRLLKRAEERQRREQEALDAGLPPPEDEESKELDETGLFLFISFLTTELKELNSGLLFTFILMNSRYSIHHSITSLYRLCLRRSLRCPRSFHPSHRLFPTPGSMARRH